MTRWFLWLGLFGLGFAAGLSAAPSPVLSYGQLGSRLERGNPTLRAARAAIAEAQGRQLGAGRLANPELELELGQGQEAGEWEVSVSLAQEFPLTARLALEREVAQREVELAQLEVEQVEQRLLAEARQKLVDLLALREQGVVWQKQIGVLQELEEVLTGLVAQGEVSVLEKRQVRLERLTMQGQLRKLGAQRLMLEGELKALIGMRAGGALSLGGSLEGLRSGASLGGDEALGGSAQVRGAQLEIQKAWQEVALEQARCVGDLRAALFASVGRAEDVPAGYEREGMVGVGLSVPLPWWDQNEGGIAEARARAQRREVELQALEEGLVAGLRAAWEEQARWQELLSALDGEHRVAVREQVELAQQAYAEGQADLQTVLRSRQQELELELSRLEALEGWAKAYARYQSLLGS